MASTVRIEMLWDRTEVSVCLWVDLLDADGRRQACTYQEKVYWALGLDAPRGLSGYAGNARLVALRTRACADGLRPLLPVLLETDRPTLVRWFSRGFREPDLRQVARLGSPRFDDYQELREHHRLHGVVGNVVGQFWRATDEERVRMEEAVTPRGSVVLRAWADCWEARMAPLGLDSADFALLARMLASGPELVARRGILRGIRRRIVSSGD